MRNLQGYFVVLNFWFLFWNCLEKCFFLPELFHNFWGFNRFFQNLETLCSRKVSYNLDFILKFYSCVTCVKIWYWACFIWNISLARVRMFLSWTETDLSFSRSSSCDDPAGTATLWQRCHVVVNVVTLWHGRKWVVPTSVSDVVTTSLSNVVKTLPQRCYNVATTLSTGLVLGHFTMDYSDFCPFTETWKLQKS